jgi:molybdopterin-guanine dinucleotide biosynthesis protein A
MKSERPPIPAVLLAGGRDKSGLTEITGEPVRGLIPIRRKPMIGYVLDALQASPSIGEIVAVGPDALAKALPGARLLPEGADLLSNIQAGLAAVSGAPYALLLTADIPFLTPEALEDFVSRGLESGGDVCYPIIPQAASEARFPGMKRTYVRLNEGRFTGGNMMLVRVDFFRKMEHLVSEAYGLRKKPLRLAQRVGLGLMIRLLIGQLRILHAETRIGRILGGKVRAVVTEYAEIGADVDKPDDLKQAEAWMSER